MNKLKYYALSYWKVMVVIVIVLIVAKVGVSMNNTVEQEEHRKLKEEIATRSSEVATSKKTVSELTKKIEELNLLIDDQRLATTIKEKDADIKKLVDETVALDKELEELNKKNNVVESKYTERVSVESLKVLEAGQASSGSFSDNEEQLHSGVLLTAGQDDISYIKYIVDNNYKYLIGTVYLRSDSKNTDESTQVSIFGDGNLIFTSGNLTKGIRSSDPSFNFELEIAAYREIEFKVKPTADYRGPQVGVKANVLN